MKLRWLCMLLLTACCAAQDFGGAVFGAWNIFDDGLLTSYNFNLALGADAPKANAGQTIGTFAYKDGIFSLRYAGGLFCPGVCEFKHGQQTETFYPFNLQDGSCTMHFFPILGDFLITDPSGKKHRFADVLAVYYQPSCQSTFPAPASQVNWHGPGGLIVHLEGINEAKYIPYEDQ